MINLRTITMQLIDGDPDGIRICRLDGESLVTIIIPRESVVEAKQLPKIPDRGVYFLLDEDYGALKRVYVGQTTRGLKRLDSHKSKKAFWNTAIMFLDDEANIDRDVLDALEARLIDYVTSHGSYETDNEDAPNPPVNPYKERSIVRLHSGILFRMKALGYDLNRPGVALSSKASGNADAADVIPDGQLRIGDASAGSVLINEEPDEEPTISEDQHAPLFYTGKNGIRGIGHYDVQTGRFFVHAGSQVNLDKKTINKVAAENERIRLFGDARGVVELEEDVEFTAPSTAAAFVLGGSRNGWTEWKNEEGRTLDSVYRKAGE